MKHKQSLLFLGVSVLTLRCISLLHDVIIGNFTRNTELEERLHHLPRSNNKAVQQLPGQTYGTLDRPFASIVSEFKLHLMQIVKEDPDVYSKEDIQFIAKVTRIAIDMFHGQWRKSGKMALNHEVGSASCMLHYKAPIEYVAIAMIHSAYFAYWKEGIVGESEHPFFNVSLFFNVFVIVKLS